MKESVAYAAERRRMVLEQLQARDIHDPRVLAAMEKIPRHLFVPREYRHLAYADGPLPIGHGQTISQPYIVALMTQLLELKGDERVLEIGTGSGYQAAILSYLAKQVRTIEKQPGLAIQAAERLRDLGIHSVIVHLGDGSQGLPGYAPYDALIATAAAPRVPQALLGQLTEGGRLVVPIGGPEGQTLQLWRRDPEGFSQKAIAAVAFVPLRGKHGWSEREWDHPESR